MKKNTSKNTGTDRAALQIETLPIDSLVPFARNSRTHSDLQVAQIAASMLEFGFTNPVLTGNDLDIIAGHGRVLAARSLGMTEVPVIRLGYLTAAQKRAYVIADNKLALNAGWDEDLLKIELTSLRDEDGFDLGLIGFSAEDLASLENDTENIEVDGDDATPGGEASYLVIGEFKIPLDEDEYNGVRAAISAYADESGTIFGFGSHLIRKLGNQ